MEDEELVDGINPVEMVTEDGPFILPYKPWPTLTGAEECLLIPGILFRFAPTPISFVERERETPGEILSLEEVLLLALLLLLSPFKLDGDEELV